MAFRFIPSKLFRGLIVVPKMKTGFERLSSFEGQSELTLRLICTGICS